MGALFLHTVRMLVRQRDILIWVVAFPIILSSLFSVMFSHFDEYYRAEPVACAVVADDNYDAPRAAFFREMIEKVSKPGEGQLLAPSTVESVEDARVAVLAGEVSCAVVLDDEALPRLLTSPLETDTLDQSIVQAVMNRYRQIYSEMREVFADDVALVGEDAWGEGTLVSGTASGNDAAPGAFDLDGIEALAQSPEVALAVQAFASDAIPTQQVDVLRATSSGTVRYYYALLGFAAVMSITVAITAVSAARANTAAVGARRQVSAMSPARQLTVAVAASFATSFAALLLSFAFMRVALGVEFGGREGLAVVALAACALTATGLGAVVGAIPRISLSGKIGISTGATCLAALFAGLYGEPSMQLADQVAQSAPWVALMNPAVQAANAFYELTYYDTLQPYLSTLGVLCLMTLVFFAVAVLLMRRQSYERF